MLVRAKAIVMALALGTLTLVSCAKGNAGGGVPRATDCPRNPAPSASAPLTSSQGPDDRPDASAMRLGVAFDIGGRGDGSFNDAAVAGVQRARKELRLGAVKEQAAAAGESATTQAARLRQLAQEGYNPIVAIGFVYGPPMAEVAREFPKTRFGLVDGVVEGAPNVTSLLFAEHEGSFLAGVIAAYKTRNCHIGFVGGVDVPLIQRFNAGFEQGARAVAPGITIDRRYLSPAGDTSGFNDPAKATEAAKGQLDAGADVIFHAAGASGKGVFAAVRQAGAMGIGVDADQYHQPTMAEYQEVIISSMIKKVDTAVYDFIRATARGDVSTLPKVFDLKTDGVGYATSGGRVDDIKAHVEAYRGEIVSGRRKVNDTLG